jgi:DNA-binding transcriptional ArsR family regulator
MSTNRNKPVAAGAVPDPAASMPSGAGLAAVFAALGDPTRLKLVAVLCAGGAFSIAQLTATTDISRQGVTKHLQVLADAGVVRDVKAGRERRWQLEPARIEEARRTLESIGQQWDVTLGKLKAFAESSQGSVIPPGGHAPAS